MDFFVRTNPVEGGRKFQERREGRGRGGEGEDGERENKKRRKDGKGN